MLLAVCDHRYKLIYIDIGAYGSQGDANIYDSSDFKKLIESENSEIPEARLLPNSQSLAPFFFVGDGAFPLQTFMMKPFGGKNLTKDLRIFNYRFLMVNNNIISYFIIKLKIVSCSTMHRKYFWHHGHEVANTFEGAFFYSVHNLIICYSPSRRVRAQRI